jgi:hypothetical protein
MEVAFKEGGNGRQHTKEKKKQKVPCSRSLHVATMRSRSRYVVVGHAKFANGDRHIDEGRLDIRDRRRVRLSKIKRSCTNKEEEEEERVVM